MLRTAITLKDAINRAPKDLSSLGTCYSIECEWKKEIGIEENSDSESNNDSESDSEEKSKQKDELNKRLDGFIDFIKKDSLSARNTFSQGRFDDKQLKNWQFSVTYKSNDEDESVVCPFSNIDHQLLVKLYKTSPTATYGNLKDMITEVNPEVRSARDIVSSHFTVDPEMCVAIADTWKREFGYAGEVRVEPYKINLYGPNGCFKEHRDTPSKDLVGTFLVGLGDTSKGSYLLVHDLIKDDTAYRSWDKTKLGSWCTFYPDLVHEVTKVESGLRANLSFKIFAVTAEDKNVKSKVDAKVKSKWDELAPCIKSPFGIILSHDYSLNADTLKGSDKTYAEVFEGLGLTIKILPVVVKFRGTYANGENETFIESSSAVYPITEESLEYLMSDDKSKSVPEPILYEEIVFFSNTKGYKWYSDQTPFCEYTGNECQPGEEDSLYLHRVMIVYP